MKRNEALEILNFYRNQHYTAPIGTEEQELADAINTVLPLIVNQTLDADLTSDQAVEVLSEWCGIGYPEGHCDIAFGAPIEQVEQALHMARSALRKLTALEAVADQMREEYIDLYDGVPASVKQYDSVRHDIHGQYQNAGDKPTLHWQMRGQRTYGGGRCYTHYCPVCGQHGYDDYRLCPSCGTPLKETSV